MKSLIVALIIAAMLVGGSIYSTNQLNELSAELEEKSKAMLLHIDKEEYSFAYIQLKSLDELMQNNELILASYLNHDELDKIEAYMAQTEAYLLTGDKGSSLAYANTLDLLFRCLVMDYKVKAENIF